MTMVKLLKNETYQTNDYGHFKNTKTGTKYIFQITGKGQQYFFQKDGINYVVDLTQDINR